MKLPNDIQPAGYDNLFNIDRPPEETKMVKVETLGASRRLTHSEDDLHVAAIQRTGFDNFGDPASYRSGLRALLEAYEQDERLTANRRQAISARIVSILSARLYTQRGWSEHPAVLTSPIRRPVIITGLPRSGTTALHRLLSMDPQFQAPEFWLTQSPMIRPPRETWEHHTAYKACAAGLAALNERSPELQSAHPTSADEIEECTTVLTQNFTSRAWTEILNLPTYATWFCTQSTRDSYRRYADVLKLIGANENCRRWLLKSPHHTGELATLLETFPDACIIQMHRDPLIVIPSLSSLFHLVREGSGQMPPSRPVISVMQCMNWAFALERAHAIHALSPEKFFDVHHRDFASDPLSIVRSIYKHFGLIMTADTMQRMTAWISSPPTLKHGPHQYRVDPLDVSETQIREIFFAYRARHAFH